MFASDENIYYAYAGPDIPALSLSIGYDGIPYTQSSGDSLPTGLTTNIVVDGETATASTSNDNPAPDHAAPIENRLSLLLKCDKVFVSSKTKHPKKGKR